MGAAQAGSLNSTRLHKAPDHTRIVFDMSGETRYSIRRVKAGSGKPFRLAIDLHDVEVGNTALQASTDGTPVLSLRKGVHKGFTRVVVDIARELPHRDFTLKPVGPYGHRVVVDLLEPDSEAPAPRRDRAPAPDAPPRDLVVAVDPGHGGEDPGAVGVDGIYEKDVVLALSKRIARHIDKERGFKAVLIRDSDYYVGLRKRMDLARERHRADLFMSVHADAFRTAEARGASVYALSRGGATSEAARWLAQSENQADLVGGVSLSEYEEGVRKVLIDISMDVTLADSLAVAGHLVREMGGVTRMHSRRVEQASFVVLKSPDVPSVLIESGYLSNPAEARRLATGEHQEKLARAISRGVFAWFREKPPEGTLVAQQMADRERTREYTVRRGDTLSEIAQRHRVDLARLRDLNDLASDRIRVGQKLRVPVL